MTQTLTQSDFKVFDFYERNKFSCLRIKKNGKVPVDENGQYIKEWSSQEHDGIVNRNKQDWISWLEDGFNIGIRTGKVSNLIIIDIDQSTVPIEIAKIKGQALVEKSKRGYHFYYKYTDKLRSAKINSLNVEVLSDGCQCVASPSIVDNVKRKILNTNVSYLSEVPKELVEFLNKKINNTDDKNIEKSVKTVLEPLVKNQRHVNLLKFIGIVRKWTNYEVTSKIAHLVNEAFSTPKYPTSELNGMLRTVRYYVKSDIKDLASKVYNYLELAEEANRVDMEYALKEEKTSIVEALHHLIKEEKIVRSKGVYKICKKADWNIGFPEIENTKLDFKVPYFNDIMKEFYYGEMIILGASSGVGKSYWALNIAKKLIEEGIEPYIILTESQSRFAARSKQIGLDLNKVKWIYIKDPTEIQIPDNGVVILDWLSMAGQYAETDRIMQQLTDKLVRKNSFLFCFVQLRRDNTFFAYDQLLHYPCLMGRWQYIGKEGDIDYRKVGEWKWNKVRDATKWGRVPLVCRFDSETGLLNITNRDEYEENSF